MEQFLPLPELTYKNKEWMVEQYWGAERSISDIAREVDKGSTTVHRWLIKLNIPRRSLSEANHLAKVNHANLTSKALEFIEGELLGDGHLTSQSKWSALYSHSSEYKQYVEWLSAKLASFGIEQAGGIRQERKHGSVSWHYTSLAYEELRPLYERWYPKGDKVVPPDLVLTPLMVRQWYIGDGSLKKSRRKCPRIILATYCFTSEDVNRLAVMLRGLGFEASRWPSNNGVHISTYSTKQFLDWMGPCPEEMQGIYGYKFAYEGEPPSPPSSKYRGVGWHKRARKWQAWLRVNSKQICLGYFDDEREAAQAHDKAARKYYGEKARLNFPARGSSKKGGR